MAITVLNLPSAVKAFDDLCATNLKDIDIDTLVSTVVAKQFDGVIDEALDKWLHVAQDELEYNLNAIKEETSDTPTSVHDLLYDVHESFGHLGLIIRLVIIDNHGNILVQTEEIDNDSYRFYIDSKNSVFQCPRYGNLGY